MSTITDRVAAGAAFLDEHDPEWWRADVERAIDLDTLNLASGSMCVLGQRCPREMLADFLGDRVGLYLQPEVYAYSAYAARLRMLSGAGLAWGHDLGFDDDVAADDPDDDGSRHAALTAEWTRVITERRTAP